MAGGRRLAARLGLSCGAACALIVSCSAKLTSSAGALPSDAGNADAADASLVTETGTADQTTEAASVDAGGDGAASSCPAPPSTPTWKLAGLTTNLHAVWGTCANDVWAVGDSILHWDGRGWSVVPAPGTITPTTLRAVWGSARNDVWAGGDRCAMTRWDGNAWASPLGQYVTCPTISALWGSSSSNTWALEGPSDAGNAGNPTRLRVDDDGGAGLIPQAWAADSQAPWAAPEFGYSLWGTGPNDVWAACQTEIQHWDGMTWSAPIAQPASSPALALWGTSDTDVWAGGTTGVFHWNGATWTSVTTPLASVDAIWGSSPGDVWLGGSSGLVHWDGQSFGALTATPHPVEGLWGAAANDVWAVGAQTQLMHFDGSTWSPSLGSVTSADIGAIWGSSESDVWILGGSSAGPYAGHWDGAQWSTASLPVPERITGAWGSSSSDVWATTPNHIAHWDGSTWTDITPSGGSGAFVAPWGSASNDVWVVAGNAALHWDGSSWSAPTTIPLVSTMAIWGGGPDDIWACGETQRLGMSEFAGGLAHWDGTAWQLAPWSADAGFYASYFPQNEALWGTSDGGYWANLFESIHFTGAGWAPTLPSVGTFYGTAANDIWALASKGAAHFDGNAWTVMPMAGPVQALWSSGPGHAWAVGSAGTIAQYRN